VTYASSGTYQSPPCDWGVPAKLIDLTVAADLNGGRVTATIEASDNGFRTIQAQMKVPIRDGVHAYPVSRVLVGR